MTPRRVRWFLRRHNPRRGGGRGEGVGGDGGSPWPAAPSLTRPLADDCRWAPGTVQKEGEGGGTGRGSDGRGSFGPFPTHSLSENFPGPTSEPVPRVPPWSQTQGSVLSTWTVPGVSSVPTSGRVRSTLVGTPPGPRRSLVRPGVRGVDILANYFCTLDSVGHT